MTKLTFDLEIRFASDWHVGSGEGRHRKIDRLIDRDRDGLPYARAGTIRGIWRDGLQELAYGLDAGIEFADPATKQKAPWGVLVDALLGSEPVHTPNLANAPVQSRLKVSDARLGPALQRKLVGDNDPGKAALRDALTFVKPGVAIDHRSGRAKTDYLRFEEIARSGAVLHASGQIDLPEATDEQTVAAFLAGGSALVETLGGKRRRGMGECTWTVAFKNEAGQVIGGDAASAAGVLATASAPDIAGDEAKKTGGGAKPRSFSAAVSTGEWLKIPLRITLLSPLLVADEVQGNVVTCQDFIPGGYLLPPLAARLANAGLDPWSYIVRGDIRVLPATPEISGQRSLPLPFCWERPKDQKDFEKLRLTPRQYKSDDRQHMPLRKGFVAPRADDMGQPHVLLDVEKVLRTHNTVKDDI